MPESIQHKLSRVRPPRVHITYDVETGGAIQKKELPMVVGILADLSGQKKNPLQVKERKFTEIDRDNFNDVLRSIEPTLALAVPNELQGDGSRLRVELKFQHLDDFSPVSVLRQVEPLRKLLEARQRLIDLNAKMDGNDELINLLRDVLENSKSKADLKKALGK